MSVEIGSGLLFCLVSVQTGTGLLFSVVSVQIGSSSQPCSGVCSDWFLFSVV